MRVATTSPYLGDVADFLSTYCILNVVTITLGSRSSLNMAPRTELISLEDAINQRPKNASKQTSFDFFDTFGTSDCSLDCIAYASRQKLSPEAIKTTQASHEEFIKRGRHRVVQGKEFTYDDLTSSALSGCGTCAALKTMLQMLSNQDLVFTASSTTVRWITRHSGTLEITTSNGRGYYLRILNVAGSKNIFRRLQITNSLAGDTSSPLSLQRVRSWVADCGSNHQQCGRGVDMKLPTRLIDVTKISRPDEEGVRLVKTQGKTGTYMCLSHCWGKILIESKTENASLEDRLRFIPWSLLPPSFQQAIEYTRKLGIRYLWIDSLCIIQDNAADWEREAAQMVDVYRNAYATIAISWSHNSQGGCYSKTIPPLYLKITSEKGDEFTIALALGAKRDDLSEYERVQEYFPLFNRAWCLQERLLSRRIIHFNFGEIAFDCGKGYSCECGGKQHYNWHNVVDLSGTYTPLRSRSKYLALLNNSTTVSSNAIMTEKGKLDPYVRWHRLVSEYTCLNLTVTADMLPAFSGLARETAEITGDSYLAGLWKNNLEQDLMWHVVSVADWRSQREKILKRGWVAPSWSWASTGSGCKVGFPIFSGAEVLEKKTPGIAESARIICPASSADPTGSVLFGRLEAESRRLSVLIQRPCSRWDVKRRWTDRVYGRFLLYAREDDREWQEDCRPSTGQEPFEFGPVKSSLWVDPIVEKMGRQQIRKKSVDQDYKVGLCKHCAFLSAEILYIRGMKTDKGALSSRLRDFFLVVTQDPEMPTGDYIRVGMLEIISDNRKDREDWFKNCWEQLALPSNSIAIS